MDLPTLSRAPAPRIATLCQLLACLFLLLSSLVHAAAPGQLRFEQLGVERGLPHPSVSAILQDRAGFMWFAGQGGLSRYDGYRFVTYKHDPLDPRSLADDSVQALIEDRTGQLWVGTRNGLQRFDRQREDFTPYLGAAPGLQPGDYLDVRAIAADRSGQLWLATRTGLVRFDPASKRVELLRHRETDPSSLASDEVYALAFDAAGDSGPVPPPASTTWRPAAAASPTFRWRHRRRPIPSASRCARWPSTPRRSGSAPRAGWKHGRPAAASRVRAVISARKRASARARSPRCTATGKAGSGQAPRTKA
ncbi:hypothetical protein G4G28_12005 [Massilia sp. Dwa41.01b]|uniref:ligand-binding sensor domain-containing protein n=1 Tax=Massilia sp. Dwa41.01b TaxID=2709302 RepID=UPI001604751C|nr:two-component regulator propeller domain-containing protein [Massilia sp. Dwa41.01b]QNA89022.1 hypothetical protein G4G28_12005 [Massilia sp. Dwa41.01b]